MIKYSIIILALMTLILSCSEQEEKTDFDKILEKIESGNGDENDLDDLLESMSNHEGTSTISFPKGKFKITFPVTNVKETSTTQIINNEEVEIFHHTANMEDRDHVNLAYQLNYVFLPEIQSDEEIDELFNEQREYVISVTNSELEFEKVIELNEARGRHLYMTVDKSDVKVNYKMYFKNGILYTMEVVTENGKLFNKSISNFFDSFEITE